MNSMWLRVAGLCAALALASCGGGGGSGPSLRVTSDRTSIDFFGFSGAPPTSQSVQFALADGSGTYYGQIVPDRPNDFSATFTPTSTTTASVTLTPQNAQVGVRSGSLVFRLCKDQGCNDVAWSQTMPYRYAMFGIDRTALAVGGFEGGAAAVKAVAITPADSGGLLTVSTRLNSGSGWLAATRGAAGDVVNVSASTDTVAAGTYNGVVDVQFASVADSPRLSIPVGFTVGSGFVVPASANLELSAESAAPAGSTDVAFKGSLNPAWTPSSDQPWLIIDTTSVNGAGTLRYHANAAGLAGLANWSSTTANVTLRAAGLKDAKLTVTLDKHLPEVYVTSPGTIVAGRASTVRVIGRGLSKLAGTGRITIAGTGGMTGTVLSDREAVLNVPALAAGRATVAVTNAAGQPAWTGTLGAAAPVALPSGSVTNVGEKRSAFFDPTRNALYAVNLTQNTLVRFRFTGGQWQVDGQPVASIGDMAMSPDRKTIYVSSGTSTLLAIDPDTLQTRATYTRPSSLDVSLSPGGYPTRGIAVTNNLRLWFGDSQWSSLGYFDMMAGSFGTQALVSNPSLYSPVFYAPGDGSKLYIVNPPMLSPRLPSYVYTTATDKITAPANEPGPYSSVAYSEDGASLLVDDQTLYNAGDFSLIGSVAVTGAIGKGGVVSPDGTRVYRLVTANTKTSLADHIDVYDTSQVQPGTSALVKLGQIPVATQAFECSSQSTSSCSVRGVFLISPLGDTLFWVGNQRLVVFPIPASLSGVQSAQANRLRAASR